jgi:positive regulator of sigma E activity
VTLVVLFVAAIVAMAFSLEYLSLTLFAAGLLVGVWQDHRATQRRTARETHQRLMREVRRPRR